MIEPTQNLKPAPRDAELLRELLLTLEQAQRSPRQAFILSISELAESLDQSPRDVEANLDFLQSLELIEGSGRFEDDGWIFRKLTSKGSQIADRIRENDDWDRIKQSYAETRQLHDS